MTPKQLYEKMDQVAESQHYSPTERSEALASLLKVAYDGNIPIPVLLTDNGTHPVYFILDAEHPLTIGNRFLICYTSLRKGNRKGFGPDVQKGYVLPRPFLNNVFNKQIIGGLVFNPSPVDCILVPKKILEAAIPGYHPRPEGFIDVEVSGYPKNMPEEWI